MEYTVENLEKAVSLFYRSDAGQQADAHQWLNEAQNSPQAWSFVWELLQPQRSSEVQFFAATTLHTKLLKYWSEVPVDHYEMLKKKILEAIVDFAMGPKIVLNRLCITLSAYIIHTIPVYWPKPFEELVSSFQPQYLPQVEPERVVWILLEILTVIPEEFTSSVLASSQRTRVRTVLQDVSQDILKVVEMCLVPIPNANFDMSNLTTYLHASRCATTWIQLGGIDIEGCSRMVNLLIDLTCFVYWNRSEPDCLSSEEQELTETTLEGLTAVMQHQNTHKFRSLVVKHTRTMLDKFNKIIDVETANAEMNKDILSGIYLLIESSADAHCKIFIDNLRSNNEDDRKVSTDLFTFLIRCTDLPGYYPVDETSSIISFGFWYTLQDEVIMDRGADLLLAIKPYYRQLACVMLRKSMFPPCDDNSWSLDDKEMFRCYRQDISDTFMYCYNVLNIEMLDIFILKLEEGLQKCTADRQSWQLVESSLHAFSSIAECIEMENLYLPKLMQTLKNVPYGDVHPKVFGAALECVGAYSEWMVDHPDVLTAAVPLIVSGIGNPDVTPSATMALKDLTHYCQKYLCPYTDLILVACQTSLQSGNLQFAECIRIMFSIGKIVSILPAENVMQYLNVILAPSFDEIQSVVNEDVSQTAASNLVTRLKMLSALFGAVYFEKHTTSRMDKPPLIIVMQDTMPLYNLIASKYNDNAQVIEVLCTVLKHALTSLMDESKPLISDILQLLVDIYRKVPQPSVLEVAKTMTLMFGKEDDYAASIRCLIAELSNITLQICVRLNSLDQLSDMCELIEAFFGMFGQIYKKSPQLILASGLDMSAFFQCAIVCLNMPELHAVKVCTTFLVHFIMLSRDTEQQAVVQNFGESLVMRVLLTLGGTAPRGVVDVLTDVLLILNKKYCDNLTRWLHSLLQQEGFPSNKITAEQKDNFIKSVLREKANKRKLSESVMEFTLICRGIIRPGMIYAA